MNSEYKRFIRIALIILGVIFWPFGIGYLLAKLAYTHVPNAKLKYFVIILIVLPSLLIGSAWASALFSGQSSPIGSEKPTQVQQIAHTPSPIAKQVAKSSLSETSAPQVMPIQSAEPSVSSDPATAVLVTRVIDGDTIEIEGGLSVRYIGVDTPETVDPRKSVQCFGKEASSKNKELLLNKRVRLEKDVSETDKYGRLLRYVYVGDLFVNDALVRQGFAHSSSYPPDVKFQAQFRAAEQEARAANRGLWSACPAGTTTSVTSNTTTAQQSQSPTGECAIKGNISSSGEKIYHLPGCGSYDKTVIDTTRGERYFCTESEALAAGWRKALNCP